ncbi:hypothetical protein LguiB_022728 [Lonicera macranthoides]
MMQFPAFMTQYPWSMKVIPTSYLLPAQWPQPHSDELLLAMEESDFEDKGHDIGVPVGWLIKGMADYEHGQVKQSSYPPTCNEMRKMNSNLVVIGKTTIDNDKEDFDNDADDDDADNAEESEVDEFEQETG